ncbi:Uncharacterized protein YR821_1237 [Yersinia ruckeri]|uniref:Uncharacterized protein n=1 Tax=Yersinia ruckeri TaxID=29486 RepID=A0A0A8VHI1_YERRU|nr:Uncharacterized protein YR821_1237 [Yersinia ruckeri]CEK27066.1 hypothetical protein CSF007_6545 [Yersinia ruckeri]
MMVIKLNAVHNVFSLEVDRLSASHQNMSFSLSINLNHLAM